MARARFSNKNPFELGTLEATLFEIEKAKRVPYYRVPAPPPKGEAARKLRKPPEYRYSWNPRGRGNSAPKCHLERFEGSQRTLCGKSSYSYSRSNEQPMGRKVCTICMRLQRGLPMIEIYDKRNRKTLSYHGGIWSARHEYNKKRYHLRKFQTVVIRFGVREWGPDEIVFKLPPGTNSKKTKERKRLLRAVTLGILKLEDPTAL